MSQEILKSKNVPAVPGKEEGPSMNPLSKVVSVDLDEFVIAALPWRLCACFVDDFNVAAPLHLGHGAPLLTHAAAVFQAAISTSAASTNTVILRATSIASFWGKKKENSLNL